MLLPTVAVVAGLAALVWSADRFVDGASTTARHLGMPACLLGWSLLVLGRQPLRLWSLCLLLLMAVQALR